MIRALFNAVCFVALTISAVVVAAAVAMLVLDRAGEHAAAILALVIAWVALVYTAWSDGNLK